MEANRSQSPIFIIGSYRSGTSVLTWCLGQHPNILALEETNWIAYLSVYLDNLYRLGTVNKEHSNISSIGVTEHEFNTFFGRCVHGFIKENIGKYLEASKKRAVENPELLSEFFQVTRSEKEPKARWIDGTPENSHFVYGLNRVFPDAKFIHLLRNPIDVAQSLQNFASAGGIDYTEEEAYRTWIRLVTASVEAENALGADKVIRVNYEDVVARPKEVIASCLKFIGEEFYEDCLLPLNKKINSSRCKRTDDKSIDLTNGKAYVREAFSLYQDLVGQKITTIPSAAAQQKFESVFLEFARQFRLEEVDRLIAWGTTLNERVSTSDQRINELQDEVITLSEWGRGLDEYIHNKDNQVKLLMDKINKVEKFLYPLVFSKKILKTILKRKHL